jgi:hypothetical protein
MRANMGPESATPKWKRFIAEQFLRGEQDGYNEAAKSVKEVRTIDNNAGSVLESSLQIFTLAYASNHAQRRFRPGKPWASST